MNGRQVPGFLLLFSSKRSSFSSDAGGAGRRAWAAAKALRRLALLAVALVFLSSPHPLRAQITDLNDATMTPYQGAGHDYIKLLGETVNPANGSVSVNINIPTPPGRGISLPFSIEYNSGSVNSLQASPITGYSDWVDGGGTMSQGGWGYTAPSATNANWTTKINNNETTCYYSSGYVFNDPNGGSHPLNLGLLVQQGNPPNCTDYGEDEMTGTDGVVTGSLITTTAGDPSFNVVDVHGTVYSFSGSAGSTGQYPVWISDRNGNYITSTSSAPGVFSFTDTLGRTVVSSNGFGPSGHTNTITTTEGSYSVAWTTASADYTVGSTLLSGIASYCTAPPAVSASRTVISSITLPNGKEYQFEYDPTYGLLKEIVYPTGATVSYTWKLSDTNQELAIYPQTSGSGFCYWEYQVPVVATRTVSFTGSGTSLTQTFGPYDTTWSTSLNTWTGRTNKVVTTDPVLGSSQTTYTYTALYQPTNNLYSLAPGTYGRVAVESQVEQYDWGNTTTPLKTDIEGWNSLSQMTCDVQALNGSGTYSGVFYQYYSYFNPQYIPLYSQVADKREYDWGGVTASACTNGASPPSGAPLRDTTTTYQTVSVPVYYGGTATFGVPSTIETCGGVCSASTLEAETIIAYDGGTLTSYTNLPTQHDKTDFPASFTTRGNPTVVTQCQIVSGTCSGSSSTNSVTTYAYDLTGNVVTKTDPCGSSSCSDISGSGNHTTTYSYADSFTTLSGGSNSPYTPSGTTYAYLTQVTNGLSQSEEFTYDFNNGQLTASTDPNSETTKYLYDDPFSRPTQVNYPDGGETTYAYNDSSYSATAHTPSVTASQEIVSGSFRSVISASDGLDHVVYSLVSPDSYGNDEVDTAYYGTGSVYKVSNPHRSGSSSTDGTTTYVYDGLGRKTKQTQPDGSARSWSYSTNTVTATDEAGNQWEDTTDGLGRLTNVYEPGVTVQTPTIPTSYTYDALNDLLTATQTGVSGETPRARTFAYDSLGHLLTAVNPENGTVTYAYDLNGNLAKKTDARSLVVHYGYDVLNRLIQKTFGSSSIYQYYYDAATSNGIGRLTHASNDVNAAENFYYDAMGRLTSEPFCIPSDCSYSKSIAAQYDLAGDLTQLTYPDGEVLQIARDGIDRASTATYWNASPSAYQYASFTGYYPPGQLSGASLGNGLTESRTYNNRYQMTNLTYENGGTDLINRSYTWTNGSGKNNGNLWKQTDNLVPGNTLTYGYDTLNRVNAATQQQVGSYAQTFSYDSFGNLSQAGSFTFSQGYTADNQINGWSYDASGDLLGDQSTGCDLSYDALGQLTAVSACTTASYVYDAENRRVRSNIGSNWMEDVYFGGELMAQKNQAGTWTDYIRVDGKLLARTSADVSTYYETDHLGSVQQTTSQSGSSVDTWMFTPFGEDLNGSGTSEVLTFTGQQTDYESGLDYFGARQYSYRTGRFMTPDPAGMMAANLEYPQSLNRYAYVWNNPLSFVDPTGLDCAYLNDAGTGLEEGGLDQNSNATECGQNGGYWVNGALTNLTVGGDAQTVSLTGTTNGTDTTTASYLQNTTVDVGMFFNTPFNPADHVAIGSGNGTMYGLNPQNDGQFYRYKLTHWQGGPGVPGAVKKEAGGQLDRIVHIPATGMQSAMIQSQITQGIQNPPNYDISGGPHTCDCASWPQQILGDAGINSGPPTQVPNQLLNQLENLYPQQQQ